MPLYEFGCQCGAIDERLCRPEETSSQVCECGATMAKRITGAKVVGPTTTKPVTLGGKVIETASGVSKWENANPGLIVKSKTDSSVKDKIYKYRHKRETDAQKAGHKNERARLAEAKRQSQLEARG